MLWNKNVYTEVSLKDSVNDNSDGFLNHVARYLSYVFSPPLTALYGVVAVTYFLGVGSKWLWALMFILLFVFPPTAYVYFLLRKGVVSDFHINRKEQRAKPILFIFVNTIIATVVYNGLGGPRYLSVLAVSSLFLLAFMFIVTFFYKISGHCAAVGGLIVVLFLLFGDAAITFTPLIPLVAWSRVKLKRHSLAQTVSGLILGVVTFIFVLYLYGLM